MVDVNQNFCEEEQTVLMIRQHLLFTSVLGKSTFYNNHMTHKYLKWSKF